jgi:hypothetical protein
MRAGDEIQIHGDEAVTSAWACCKEMGSDSCFACVQGSMTYLYSSALSGVSAT